MSEFSKLKARISSEHDWEALSPIEKLITGSDVIPAPLKYREAAAAELAALREENQHRFARCTWCDWEHHYTAGGKDEADKLANAHALTCDQDPRVAELTALRARIEVLEAEVKYFIDECGWDIPKLKAAGEYEITGAQLKRLAAALEGA